MLEMGNVVGVAGLGAVFVVSGLCYGKNGWRWLVSSE